MGFKRQRSVSTVIASEQAELCYHMFEVVKHQP